MTVVKCDNTKMIIIECASDNLHSKIVADLKPLIGHNGITGMSVRPEVVIPDDEEADYIFLKW